MRVQGTTCYLLEILCTYSCKMIDAFPNDILGLLFTTLEEKRTRLSLRATCRTLRDIHDATMTSAIVTDVRKVTQRREGTLFSGFELVTSPEDHGVRVLIDQGRYCCERYGTGILVRDSDDRETLAASDDDYVDGRPPKEKMQELFRLLYGKKIWNVRFEEDDDDSHTDTNRLTVRVRTKDGLLVRLVAYNEHNGYYPHNTVVGWHGFEDTSNSL